MRVVDITIRNLDPEAYRRIKARAALDAVTLGEAVSEALRQYLERPAAKRPGGQEVREGGSASRLAGPRPRVSAEQRRLSLQRLLEEEIWPRVPEELLGRGLSKRELEEILGLGPGEEG